MINVAGVRLRWTDLQRKLLAAEVAMVGRKPPVWDLGEIVIWAWVLDQMSRSKRDGYHNL